MFHLTSKVVDVNCISSQPSQVHSFAAALSPLVDMSLIDRADEGESSINVNWQEQSDINEFARISADLEELELQRDAANVINGRISKSRFKRRNMKMR